MIRMSDVWNLISSGFIRGQYDSQQEAEAAAEHYRQMGRAEEFTVLYVPPGYGFLMPVYTFEMQNAKPDLT